MIYDTTSYLLAHLKLASMQRRLQTNVQNTKNNRVILSILQKLGYITTFFLTPELNKVCVQLKYNEKGETSIRSIKRISRPGSRVYISCKSLAKFSRVNNLNNTYQVIILSTSKGILPHSSAVSHNVGGEVLFIVS